MVVVVVAAITLGGCAGPIRHWIVATRVHQGDVAMRDGALRDAVLAYRLALKVDPRDRRARDGFVAASAAIAHVLYTHGDFEDALATIRTALRYDPQSVRLQALRNAVEEAKLKQEIVISNYPTYRQAGADIQTSYAELGAVDKAILHSLHRFAYTYDTADLTAAIKQSYELQLDVAKLTNRLIVYRQLVESGIPSSGASEGAPSSRGSLLPLP